ncbi:hypothetical protein VTN77DRAFT_8420 [Rasamsonia byssochlamydoides]|uniref:uncharacterized protein n=1 Tax=Rasamsonia byssochlamydoides TaxID=89139 RepID=UPI0037439A41
MSKEMQHTNIYLTHFFDFSVTHVGINSVVRGSWSATVRDVPLLRDLIRQLDLTTENCDAIAWGTMTWEFKVVIFFVLHFTLFLSFFSSSFFLLFSFCFSFFFFLRNKISVRTDMVDRETVRVPHVYAGSSSAGFSTTVHYLPTPHEGLDVPDMDVF